MKTRTLAIALMLFLTSMAAFAVSTATYNIEAATPAATPNDTSDDKAAIQNAIDTAYAAGGGDVFVPAGTYLISGSLYLKSNVRLRGVGSGSIIKATDSANMVSIEQATNAEVRDLKLDGNVHSGSGVRMVGSSHCIVDNVVITGIGVTTTSPGGSFISIEAYESGDSHNPFSGNTLQATRNQVRNCLLDDSAGIAMFGITLTTRWEAASTVARTAFNENNVISGNTIIGFRWNSIEIAGPATIGNTISGNIAVNHQGYSAIEADKGASYNTYTGNVVRKFQITSCGSAGCPTAYRAQKGDSDTSGDYHIAKGNVFTGNVFEGLGSLSGGAGMYLDGASDTVVSGNTFDVTGGSGAETYGVETNIRVDRAQITGNLIRGAKYGVGNVTQSFATTQRDITVASNTIEASHYGVAFLTSSSTSGYENLVVRDNTIRGTLTYFGVIFGLKIDKSIVQGNHIIGAAQGVLIAGDRDMVLTNAITNTTTYGVRMDSASTNSQTFGNVATITSGSAYSNGGTSNTDRFNSWT
jgi:polygalacturonase